MSWLRNGLLSVSALLTLAFTSPAWSIVQENTVTATNATRADIQSADIHITQTTTTTVKTDTVQIYPGLPHGQKRIKVDTDNTRRVDITVTVNRADGTTETRKFENVDLTAWLGGGQILLGSGLSIRGGPSVDRPRAVRPVTPAQTVISLPARGGQIPWVEFQAGGGGQLIVLPKRTLLGSETGGTARLDLFTPDRDATGANAWGSVKFNLGAAQHVRFSGFYAEFQSRPKRPYASIRAPGATLSDSRVRMAAPPVSRSAANPFNIVRDASYSAELEKFGGRVGIRPDLYQPARRVWGRSMRSTCSIWRPDTSTCRSTSASPASVPGFARNFVYVSNADVDQFNVQDRRRGSSNTLHQPRTGSSSRSAARSRPVRIFRPPSAATGSPSPALPIRSAPSNRSTTEFGFGAGAFVGFELQGGLKIMIDGRYMRDTGLPVFVRDGTNPTTARSEERRRFFRRDRARHWRFGA